MPLLGGLGARPLLEVKEGWLVRRQHVVATLNPLVTPTSTPSDTTNATETGPVLHQHHQ